MKIEGDCEGKSLTAEKISVEGTLEVDALKVEDSEAKIENLVAEKICGGIF